ncbi:MAG TPA: hypothetical protein VJP85_04515 [Candidatus Baltobacteraceae bacterium]|nr:hypothetical protein [Candidatus Baltobacteraceae bacterium]
MSAVNVTDGRLEVMQRLLILDGEYRIISTQCAGGDAIFGFSTQAARLPVPLESAVRAATSTWTGTRHPESLTVLDRTLAMRVFPLLGTGARTIGVLFERYRCRAADALRT